MALTRSDIVGHAIERVLTERTDHEDGFVSDRVCVQLSNGIAFELMLIDPDADPTDLPVVDVDDFKTAPDLCEPTLVGKEIAEVAASRFWPSIGLLTADGRLLYLNSPFPEFFGAEATRLDERYALGDLVTYWGKHPIA